MEVPAASSVTPVMASGMRQAQPNLAAQSTMNQEIPPIHATDTVKAHRYHFYHFFCGCGDGNGSSGARVYWIYQQVRKVATSAAQADANLQ